MTDVAERLATSRLYLCTDGRRRTGDLAEFLDAVLAAGVDIVRVHDVRPNVRAARMADAILRGRSVRKPSEGGPG